MNRWNGIFRADTDAHYIGSTQQNNAGYKGVIHRTEAKLVIVLLNKQIGTELASP